MLIQERKYLRNHNGYTYKLFKESCSILKNVFILQSSTSYHFDFSLHCKKYHHEMRVRTKNKLFYISRYTFRMSRPLSVLFSGKQERGVHTYLNQMLLRLSESDCDFFLENCYQKQKCLKFSFAPLSCSRDSALQFGEFQ